MKGELGIHFGGYSKLISLQLSIRPSKHAAISYRTNATLNKLGNSAIRDHSQIVK